MKIYFLMKKTKKSMERHKSVKDLKKDYGKLRIDLTLAWQMM